jgi:hypothetical protein
VSSACACGAVTSAGGRIGGNKSSSAAGGSDTALPNGMLKIGGERGGTRFG